MSDPDLEELGALVRDAHLNDLAQGLLRYGCTPEAIDEAMKEAKATNSDRPLLDLVIKRNR